MLPKEVLARLKNVKIDNFNAIEEDDFKKIRNVVYKNELLYLAISNRIINIIKNTHVPLGNWNQNPLSSTCDFGVVINGKWNRIMTMDTNYTGQLFLFRQCNIFLDSLKKSGISQIKIGDKTIPTTLIHIPYNWDLNIDININKIFLLLDIIELNANEWMVPGNTVCDELLGICYRVMLKGDVAEKIFQLYDTHFFKNFESISYTTGLGDLRDRKEGSDMWIKYDDGTVETNQIKFGGCRYDGGSFVTRSLFYPSSRCTYFTIVDPSSITFIRNDGSMKLISDIRCFDKKSIIKQINILNMYDELSELLFLSQKYDIQIEITKHDNLNDVKVNFDEKKVFINFSDESDESFKSKLSKVSEELKQRFV
jgi:hypothetical protein